MISFIRAFKAEERLNIRSKIFVVIFFLSGRTIAGPPFRTDDPIPVPYSHGELYLFSTGTIDDSGTSGIGPAVEFNYGILHDTQFHLVLPLAFNAPKGASPKFGYGDTELGVKFRFIDQGNIYPDVATFPLMEIPTGSASRGLGNGKAHSIFHCGCKKTLATGQCMAARVTGLIPGLETETGISPAFSSNTISLMLSSSGWNCSIKQHLQ